MPSSLIILPVRYFVGSYSKNPGRDYTVALWIVPSLQNQSLPACLPYKLFGPFFYLGIKELFNAFLTWEILPVNYVRPAPMHPHPRRHCTMLMTGARCFPPQKLKTIKLCTIIHCIYHLKILLKQFSLSFWWVYVLSYICTST